MWQTYSKLTLNTDMGMPMVKPKQTMKINRSNIKIVSRHSSSRSIFSSIVIKPAQRSRFVNDIALFDNLEFEIFEIDKHKFDWF